MSCLHCLRLLWFLSIDFMFVYRIGSHYSSDLCLSLGFYDLLLLLLALLACIFTGECNLCCNFGLLSLALSLVWILIRFDVSGCKGLVLALIFGCLSRSLLWICSFCSRKTLLSSLFIFLLILSLNLMPSHHHIPWIWICYQIK